MSSSEHDETAIELKRLPKPHDGYDGEDGLDEDDERESSDVVSIESFEMYTPDEEAAIVKKFDRRVVLFMSFLYLLSFLDRSNIGNAKIAGMTDDLDMKDNQFDWLLTAFYITYILFEWMILLYHVLTPHVYISICVLSWGLVASLQSLATSFSYMVVLRALLGIGEAAFSPGVPFYLSFFYRREELALRAGMQVSAAPLAASFAGSLAWVITKIGERSPVAPWRLLFLAEGFPSIIVAVIAWSYVPDSPETAGFLTPRQQTIAKLRLRKDGGLRESSATSGGGLARLNAKKKIEWSGLWETLKDPKSYLLAIMFSLCNVAFSSMPVFLPSVINEMGYSSINSQALSAPPFLFAFVAMLATAKLSDKMATRSPFVCFHALMACAGYSLIAAGGHFGWPNVVRYLSLYPAAAGFFSAITIIITWTMNNQESNSKKGMGMTILNVIGQCGPLVGKFIQSFDCQYGAKYLTGTRLFPDSDQPAYVPGMLACAGAMLIVFVLAIVLRIVLIMENRRRATAFKQEAADRSELLRGSGDSFEYGRFILML